MHRRRCSGDSVEIESQTSVIDWKAIFTRFVWFLPRGDMPSTKGFDGVSGDRAMPGAMGSADGEGGGGGTGRQTLSSIWKMVSHPVTNE